MTMETQIYWAVMSGDELTENYLVWSKITVFLELPRSLVQDDMYYWTKPCPRCTKPLTDLNVATGCKGCGYILASG